MWYRKLFVEIVVLVCSTSFAVAQEATRAVLKVSASNNVMQSAQIFDLEITLRNTSKESFYVCGDINYSLLNPWGQYDLQIRPLRSEEPYKTTLKWATDPLDRPYGSPLSPEAFRAQKNLLLLQPQQFIGIRESGTWKELTAMLPGEYELRVVYSSRGPLPVKLDRPFLLETIISNVIQIEVLP